MIVRLRRPSRSIFSRPMASISLMANWVVTSPLTRLVEGDELGQRLRGDDHPGRVDGGVADLAFDLLGEGQQMGDLRLFLSRSSRRAGTSFRALVERHLLARGEGDHLGDLVHLGQGHFQTRPTSRMAARAAIVPKVMIWLTFSSPYFSRT